MLHCTMLNKVMINILTHVYAMVTPRRGAVLYREINLFQDGYTRYLNRATDAHDLERRIRDYHAQGFPFWHQ
jgi:hypothetical protein